MYLQSNFVCYNYVTFCPVVSTVNYPNLPSDDVTDVIMRGYDNIAS